MIQIRSVSHSDHRPVVQAKGRKPLTAAEFARWVALSNQLRTVKS